MDLQLLSSVYEHLGKQCSHLYQSTKAHIFKGTTISGCSLFLQYFFFRILIKWISFQMVNSMFCYYLRLQCSRERKYESHFPKSEIDCGWYFNMEKDLLKQYITKTYLYNFDTLKPHFYIIKLGFTGVYIIFLISAQNIDCGYLLEPPRRGGSNEYPQSMFCAEIWKISEFFLSENVQFLEIQCAIHLNRHVFVMSSAR